MFTYRFGLRCQVSGRHYLELPKAWLFAHGRENLKLCVADKPYDVRPLH